MKKTLALILATALSLTCMAGCSSKGPSASGATNSSASGSAGSGGNTAETLKIGIGCPLTGNSASYGELMKLGAELAAEELNANGGVNGQMVEIVAYDDKQDPKEAALVAQRFCDNEDIFAVISHGGSSLTLAAAPIYEAAGLTNMAPSSSASSVTEQGYEYLVRHVIREDRQAPQVIGFMANNLGFQKIAIVYANNDHGQGNLETSLEVAEQLGIEVVATETYNPGVEKDFSALLTKVKRANPDGIAIYADYTEGGMILGQAYQLGMEDMVWVGQSSLTYNRLIELAGVEALQNLYMTVTFNPYSSRDSVVKFMDEFQALRPGEIPSEPCAFSYDIVKVYAQAIEAGATKENLALYIKNLVPGQEPFVAYDLLLGDEVQWDSKGDVTPRGVEMLKVSPEGSFVSTDIAVDVTGINMEGVVG